MVNKKKQAKSNCDWLYCHVTHVFHIRIVILCVCVIFYSLQAWKATVEVTCGRKCNELSLCRLYGCVRYIQNTWIRLESSSHINALTVVNQDISRGRALETVGPKKERSFEYSITLLWKDGEISAVHLRSVASCLSYHGR